MDKTKVTIINPSSSEVQYVAREFTVNIPGHKFEDDPFEAEIPEKCLDHFMGVLSSRFPFIQATVIEPADAEAGPELGKDDFLSACKAKKKRGAGGIWVVTASDGREIEVEAGSKKQAAQVAYDKLHGDGER